MIVAASFFFFSSRRRHTRLVSDWSSDVCSSDLLPELVQCPWTGHPDEISVSDAVIASNIERMVDGFKSEDHEAASLAVNAILRMRPGWAVMIHNQGLVAANQRQMGIAAERLAEAGTAYLDAGQTTGSALVRRHLSAIADARSQ